MTYSKSMAAALMLTTILVGTAFAAGQATQQTSTQTNMVDKDVGKLSKDGAQGFRDLQLTRLAIFEANPAQAKDMIARAKAAFAKAKSDNAQFTKAEADLKTQSDFGNQGGTAQTSANTTEPASKDPIAWVPVEAQLTLGDDFVATPEKASAVTEANKNLSQGDRKGAIEKLKLAHVDVNFTMAVLPLDKTIADVDQAATLIGQGKYYEANAILKRAQDGMRFDVIDAIDLPQKSGAAGASMPSSSTNGAAGGTQTSK